MAGLTTAARAIDHSQEAEEAIIVSLLIGKHPDKVAATLHRLSPNEFFDPYCREAFEQLQIAHAQSEAPSVVCLHNRLKRTGVFTGMSIATWLARIDYNSCVGPEMAHVGYYIKMIKEDAVRRNLRLAAEQIDDYACDRQDGNYLRKAKARFDEACVAADSGVVHISEVLPSITEPEHRPDRGGVETGIYQLDRYLNGGLYPTQLCVIGAGTGQGKTSLAVQMLCESALMFKSCLFVSLEMTCAEITRRMVCYLSGLSYDIVANHEARTASDKKKIEDAVETIRNFKVSFAEHANTAEDVVARAHETAADVVFVDYLQLLRAVRHKTDTREQEVSSNTRAMKLLAVERKCVVVLLAQLNREGQKEKEPRLIHFRESGAIENDANVAILLHKEKKPQQYDDGGEEMRVILAKNRNGQTGGLDCVFYPHRFTIRGEAEIANRFEEFDEWA